MPGADGGKNPILPAKTLAEIGYAFAIYPSLASLSAASAMEQSLRRLKDTGLSQSPDQAIFDFMEFCELIGFKEVWDFEKKWVQK